MKIRYRAAALGFAFVGGFYVGARVTSRYASDKMDELEERILEGMAARRQRTRETDTTVIDAGQWFNDHPITQRVKREEAEAAERARTQDGKQTSRVRARLRGGHDERIVEDETPTMRDDWI